MFVTDGEVRGLFSVPGPKFVELGRAHEMHEVTAFGQREPRCVPGLPLRGETVEQATRGASTLHEAVARDLARRAGEIAVEVGELYVRQVERVSRRRR